ncbi:MAG: hypothetical protein ACKN8W_02125 [Actinomycetales bacterium]
MTYRLKSGITSWRTSCGQLRVGSRFRNFLLPDQIAGTEIESLLVDLRFGIEPTIDTAKYGPALSILADLALIDKGITPIPHLQQGKSKSANDLIDTARENFQHRFEIESSGSARREHVLDGGTEKLLARQELKISIIGEGRYLFSRIAVALFTNLLASGFSQSEFKSSTAISSDAKVEIGDLIGGFFSLGDIGLSKTELLRKSSAEISLFPLKAMPERELIISIGPPHPHTQQDSFDRKIPIFVIDFLSGELRIGPFIVPGKTPCFSCILLGEKESGSLTKIESAYFPNDFTELCASLAITGAGFASLAIAEFSDTGSSSLAGRTINFSTENFLSPQSRNWQRHPGCSCNWLPADFQLAPR